MAVLTNPRRRLDAEMGWFPGSSPSLAAQAACAELNQVRHMPLTGLAKANALTIAASNWTPNTAAELADHLDHLAQAADAVVIQQVLQEINEDRAVAGFPAVTTMAAAEEALHARKLHWRRMAMSLLERSKTSDMTEALSSIVEQAAGNRDDRRFMHDLVDDYALRMQPFLARETSTAEQLVEKISALAGTRADALPPLIRALERLLETWHSVTLPMQLSYKLRGQRDEDGSKLAYLVRNLSIDLFNEHDRLEEAKQLTFMVGKYFSNLPAISAKVAEDAETLHNISEAAARERDELTYAAELGLLAKSRLAIDPNGVEWRGRRTPLSSVRGARWGAIRRSVNGIPTGTDYLIAWSDGSITTTAEFRNGQIFEAFVPKLWRGVGIRLVNEMTSALRAGGQLRFGNMIVRNETVVLTRRKMFSSEQVEFKWADVSIKSADGSFIVQGPKGSKASEAISYRDVDNAHFLEALVRQAFEKGRLRLSDAFA